MDTIERSQESSSRLVRNDVFVFGLSFWNATYFEFRDWWQTVLRGDARTGQVVVFANANTLNHVIANPAFREAVMAADVRINDGSGFRIASRMRGVETRENLNGTDLVPRLFGDATEPIRVFVYGATEASNQGAAKVLEARFPQVRIAGRINGYVTEQEAMDAIRAAQADVVLVALGHPAQETFCVRHRETLQAKILLPIGGLVDFLSETKPRAPEAFRKAGLEWTYRLAIEPKRMFARYVLGNPLFLLRSAAHASRDRRIAGQTTEK